MNFVVSPIIFFLTLFSYCFLLPYFNKYVIDTPISRSSHRIPTPTGGGIVFVLITIFICVIRSQYYSLLILPLAIIGFLDDRLNISGSFRFSVQILTVLALMYESGIYQKLNSNFLVSLILILFVSLSVINFINFMDGVDSLVSLSMLIALSASMLLTSVNSLALISTLLAFLLFNFPPAKIFMGDVGSTFLGATYSYVLLKAPDLYTFFSLLLIISPFILDCSSCIFRRLLARESIFTPHKLHLYQRLHQSGFTHLQTSLLYAVATLFLSLVAVFYPFWLLLLSSFLILVFGIYLDNKVANKFSV